MSLPHLDADAIRHHVSMAQAIEALRAAFSTRVDHALRTHLHVAGGDLLVMPAAGGDVAGIKLVMVQPRNADRGEPTIQGTYVLFDAEAGRPVALLDGAALTALRTPAASALATDALAREDVRTLGIFGAGPQARDHVEAMRVVRPSLEEVLVCARTTASTERLCEEVGGRPADASTAAAADIVCTCTSSTTPVLAAEDVRPGAHLNLVGAYTAGAHEVPAALVGRADIVTVDERSAAEVEAGDLIQAAEAGAFDWETDLAGDLVDLVARRVARNAATQVTMFKSVGLALEDLAVAELVARRAGLIS